MQELQEHKATPEMQKFFTRLLALKKFIKEKADESKDATLIQIYDTMHSIIKDGEHE